MMDWFASALAGAAFAAAVRDVGLEPVLAIFGLEFLIPLLAGGLFGRGSSRGQTVADPGQTVVPDPGIDPQLFNLLMRAITGQEQDIFRNDPGLAQLLGSQASPNARPLKDAVTIGAFDLLPRTWKTQALGGVADDPRETLGPWTPTPRTPVTL